MHLLHVEGHLADALHRVRVEEHALLAGNLADLRDGLHRADLVVGEHHADQDGLVGDGLADVVRVDQALAVHLQVGDLVALFLEALAGVEHGLVLDHRGDEVVALVPIKLGHALEGHVVALGRAGGEHDLFRVLRADKGGDLLARGRHRLFRRPAVEVAAARRVAELLGEVG